MWTAAGGNTYNQNRHTDVHVSIGNVSIGPGASRIDGGAAADEFAREIGPVLNRAIERGEITEMVR